MDLTKFKRNISLYKLGLCELDNHERMVYDHLMERAYKLNTYSNIDDSNFLFYGQSTELIVAEYIKSEKYLMVSYALLWNYLSHILNISIEDVMKLLSWWFSHCFNIIVDIVSLEEIWHI